MNVIVMRKGLVEELTFEELKNTLVISTSSDGPIKFQGEEKNVIRFDFDDIEKNEEGKWFTEEDAKNIVAFLNSHDLKKVDKIICSCDGGVSRSSAMAAALSLYFNGNDWNIWGNAQYVPNSTVYRTLLNVLFEGKSAFEEEISEKEEHNIKIWRKAQDID